MFSPETITNGIPVVYSAMNFAIKIHITSPPVIRADNGKHTRSSTKILINNVYFAS